MAWIAPMFAAIDEDTRHAEEDDELIDRRRREREDEQFREKEKEKEAATCTGRK